MRILVLATQYPRPGYISLFYIHSRNRWYVTQGIDVTVISFSARRDYTLDGVKVYTMETYRSKLSRQRYDLLVSHAPNLRAHYRFLKKYGARFRKIVFFFHGHEVLRTSEVYPPPYEYMRRKSSIYGTLRDLYDRTKLLVWRRYFTRISHKAHFVFVSRWMFDMFMRYVKLDSRLIERRKHVIYNCVGESFEKEVYDAKTEKKYDFITIRNNLDGSKYGIDLVVRAAKSNPRRKFCVVGKGSFFKYSSKPENLVWVDKHLTHDEIIDFLNQAKCALMPTRADAQGVLACEMATFGIPVITSNLEVCKETFDGFDNVAYIDNHAIDDQVEQRLRDLRNVQIGQKNSRFFAAHTIAEEIRLFRMLKDT